MAEIELKPCPFCGGEVYFVDLSTKDEQFFMIQCEVCPASVCFGDMSETKEQAAELWNRRADNAEIH